MKAHLSVIVLFLGFITFNLNAQIDTNRISKLLGKTVAQYDIPAVSLAVVYDQKTYYFSRGRLSRESNTNVDQFSIYQIASLGKPLIGIIYQHLILEGLIDVSQPITAYLPGLARHKRNKRYDQITLDLLLHHRSGLPQDVRSSYKRKDGEPYLFDYKEDDLYQDLSTCKLRKPGQYQYSNFGYALLAFIATERTNKSFKTLLNEIITTPLGWQNTSLELSNNHIDKLATPYRKDNRKIRTQPWRMGIMAPPSGIYSTVEDFSKLLSMQMRAYQVYAKDQVVTKWVLTNNTAPKSTKSLSYGYGLNEYPGGFFGHSGDMDGYATDYSFNPAKGFGAVLMTSSGEDWINPLIREINRILEEAYADQ